MSSKKIYDGGTEMLPRDVAVCPECGGVIQVEVNEVEQDADGSWYPNSAGLYMSCWDDENNLENKVIHYQMPYIDWLPLELKVLRWLKDNYSFDETSTEVSNG